MTELARALPKNVLVAVDRYRALHGIRSRKTALEKMVQQVMPVHPLEQALQNAEKLPKGSVSAKTLAKLQKAESEPRVTLEELLASRKR